MKILFINACARKDSRTMVLAKEVLKYLDGEVKELDLFSLNLKPLDESRITARLTDPGEQEYAKEFSTADIILIAAPMWDLSFPAILKTYIENITITGITFKYTSDGPVGLCKAKKLYYVATSGGKYVPYYGFEYIKTLSSVMFGIKEFKLFFADSLDVWGSDIIEILKGKKSEISEYFATQNK